MTSYSFSLEGKPVIITGAAGLLGIQHATSIATAGGIPILLDLNEPALSVARETLQNQGHESLAYTVDSTSDTEMREVAEQIYNQVGPVHGIVNNVAANPTMATQGLPSGRLEDFSVSEWEKDHAVALTSTLLTSKHFGGHLVERGEGSIVNIASDLALISPDQRIYRDDAAGETGHAVKPMSYSSVKSAVLGITRYLATYWSPLPIRANALVPGSVKANQSPQLIANLEARIPLGRLAAPDEYQGALVFLLSDASRYMNGATLVMDGGRSIW